LFALIRERKQRWTAIAELVVEKTNEGGSYVFGVFCA
jgi:hypothetical protein